MSLWTVAWILWGLWFALVEAMALANSVKGDTLSEHVWAFLGIRTEESASLQNPDGWTRVRRFLTLAGLAWLVVHLLTGGIF